MQQYTTVVFDSERKGGRRKRSSDDGSNLEDDYEQRLSKRKHDDDDSDVEVRSLLPIKCKQMGVIRRTIEIKKRKCHWDNFMFICIFMS